MAILLRLGAVFVIALKRLVAERRLTLVTVFALTVAVAITVSIPMYAGAVYGSTLVGTLLERTPTQDVHPPFSFMFRRLSAGTSPATWDTVEAADRYLSGEVGNTLGLPVKQSVRFLDTPNFGVYANRSNSDYLNTRNQLTLASIGTASDFADHITLTEGRLPEPKGVPDGKNPADGSPVEVLMHDSFATKLGTQIDDIYILFQNRLGIGGTAIQIPVQVTGIWMASNDQDDYWFYGPWALSDMLFVPEATFTGLILPQIQNPISTVLWYLVLDGSGVAPSDSASLLQRTSTVTQQATALLPGLTLVFSPAAALQKYEKAAGLLTVLLYAFSVPILGMILVFITLVVSLTVGQQRNEIAVLRSRGGTTAQIVGIAALEALLMSGIALSIGWPLGRVLAAQMGLVRSFLDFSGSSAIATLVSPARALPPTGLYFGLAMVAVALLAQMIPSVGAARHTLVTYKQERARSLRPPWWQRVWLDVLLLIPTAYGFYLLREQGAVAVVPAATDTAANDPFQNPLFFLIPALGALSVTLLLLRLLPLAMRLLVRLLSGTRSVGLLVAARHLARSPGFYAAPLLLLVLTLSLSAFTASLARTLDDHLYDQSYYHAGADLHLQELGIDPEYAAGYAERSGTYLQDGANWLFLPVSEHLRVEGVQAATRAGRYPVTSWLSSQLVSGTFIGLDRADFPGVAFWRRDFAPRPLGALMNELALAPDGVLTSREFLREYALEIGDTVILDTWALGKTVDIAFKIVGEFELFPTWYPAEGPLFVGNLDYYFEQLGGQAPYDVWVKAGSGRDYQRIVQAVRDLGINVTGWEAPSRNITQEQQRPERQGLFGLLSVGFIAAGLLTALGFLLYALFSFRRRTIELGILRAIGLSTVQMTAGLAWELAFLIATGILAGTTLGAGLSRLFIPYLQVGSGPAARVPPFLVEVAWPAVFRIYAIFGALFVFALVILVFLLRRMKIFQALKLGETV